MHYHNLTFLKSRRLAALGLMVGAGLTLSGCGITSAVSLAPNIKMPSTASKPKFVALPKPKVLTRVPGELDSGSASHAVTVDGIQVIFNYWTDSPPSQWGPSSQGTVNVSVQVQGLPSDIIARVNNFQVVAPPNHTGGSNIILASDAGEFVIGTPYSYGSAFVIPAYPSKTKSVTIHVNVALEIETKPASGVYTRQSVIDALNVSLTPETLAEETAQEKAGSHYVAQKVGK